MFNLSTSTGCYWVTPCSSGWSYSHCWDGNHLGFYSSVFCVVTQGPCYLRGPDQPWPDGGSVKGWRWSQWSVQAQQRVPLLLSFSPCWLLPQCLIRARVSRIPVAGGLTLASCSASLPSHHTWRGSQESHLRTHRHLHLHPWCSFSDVGWIHSHTTGS